MPFGLKPSCVKCNTSDSPIWRKNEKGEIVCNSCANNSNPKSSVSAESPTPAPIKKENGGNGNGSSSSGPTTTGNTRKSTRKPTKNKQQSKQFATVKGKSRRYIFKKSATKAPVAVATPVTSESTFYKGSYFQVGDIVSLLDVEGDVYYAQIRGLLQDQYCEKSAVITWLVPTINSPKDKFDPATFIIGPEEEIPRKLECMEFVCHAPSEYFKARNSPYPTQPSAPQFNFIWTRLGPQIKPANTDEMSFA